MTATVTVGSSHSTQDVDRERFSTRSRILLPDRLTPMRGLCSISESSNNFVGGITLRQASEVMTTTIEYSQSQAPRSNGTSVVSDSFRLNFDRDLGQRFSGSINLLLHE